MKLKQWKQWRSLGETELNAGWWPKAVRQQPGNSSLKKEQPTKMATSIRELWKYKPNSRNAVGFLLYNIFQVLITLWKGVQISERNLQPPGRILRVLTMRIYANWCKRPGIFFSLTHLNDTSNNWPLHLASGSHSELPPLQPVDRRPSSGWFPFGGAPLPCTANSYRHPSRNRHEGRRILPYRFISGHHGDARQWGRR